MSALSTTYKSRQKVLGYPVDLVTEKSALEVVAEAWKTGKSLHIVTLNAEMVIAAQKDQLLDRIIRHAHLIVPDGSGVVFALKLAGVQLQRLPGIELAFATLELAAKEKKRVGLVGGKPEIIARLTETLKQIHPGINIVSARDGYWKTPEEEETVVYEVAEQKPDLLLVAMGVPRQEYFIDHWREQFPNTVLIGVGGSFDVWTGTVKRAPTLFRKFHLEWFYRLLKEPWRYKRMGSALPNFAIQVLTEAAKTKLDGETAHGERRSRKRSNHGHDKSRERSKEK